jgi:subfamily B ATP-binding cassette protein MsbA
MNVYFRLIHYVRMHTRMFILSVSSMLLTSLFKTSPITMLIPIIDRIIADRPVELPNTKGIPTFVLDLVARINEMPRMTMLNFIIAAAVVLTLLKGVTFYWQTYLMNDMSHRVIRDMRRDLYAKLIHSPLSFYSKHRSGELVSRVTYDTGIVRDAISEGLMDAIFQPIELIVNIVLLLSIRWIFGIPWSLVILITVVTPMVIYPVVRIGKMLKKVSRNSQQAMGDINASLYETVTGVRVVQAFGMEDYEKKRFGKFNSEYYRSTLSLVGRNLLMAPVTELAALVCGCAVAWIGAARVINHEMSAGAFLAFAAALFSLFRPLKRLSRLHGINQTAMAAAERVFQTMDEKNDIVDPKNPVILGKLSESIEFRKIVFSYEPPRKVLDGISFTVKKGEIVALVGPSGSGKTSLLNLLPRFYDPTEGDVRIDGRSVREASLQSLRSQIGIVTQETILFNDTVSANIAYGCSGIDPALIEEAARVANAHDFITKLPNGYLTPIGDRGFKLSGGEKQRLAIARAVLKNPPILILDEATSSLDTESERLVQDAIHKIMLGRTVLVIAHRLSTVKDASRILVLQDGHIIQDGRHDDLIKQPGMYARLHELQFNA